MHNRKLTDKIKNEFNKPFNLFGGSLFRFEIYYNNEEIELLMNVHHIIADARSVKVFIDELINLYYKGKVTNNKEFDYFDYVLDLLETKQSKLNKSINYFKDQIEDFPLNLYLN
ncbi:MAG: condensation domain-containing protein, partial [Methanobrevibacter sp.]|nr:condensation domain-containing protein [Methanobrevibacter sp.]